MPASDGGPGDRAGAEESSAAGWLGERGAPAGPDPEPPVHRTLILSY